MSFLIARIRYKCDSNQELCTPFFWFGADDDYDGGSDGNDSANNDTRWHRLSLIQQSTSRNKFMFTIIKNRNVEIFINLHRPPGTLKKKR